MTKKKSDSTTAKTPSKKTTKKNDEQTPSTSKITSFFQKQSKEGGDTTEQIVETPKSVSRSGRAIKRKIVYEEFSSDDEEPSDRQTKKRKTTATTPNKKKQEDDDEDFVDRGEEIHDDEIGEDDEVEEPEEISAPHTDEDEEEEEEEVIEKTPKKKTSKKTPAKEKTPKKSATPAKSAKSSTTTPKKKSESTAKRVKSETAPQKVDHTPSRLTILYPTVRTYSKRPKKSEADGKEVVKIGRRTFLMTKRIADNRKQLFHYFNKDVIAVRTVERKPTPSVELIQIFDENDQRGKMSVFVNIAPVKQDFAQKVPKKLPSEVQAIEYVIPFGEGCVVNSSTIVANVGAGSSIWCIDWCRVDPSSVQYAAFCCHPHKYPYTKPGFTIPPPSDFPLDNMIQIWSMGSAVSANRDLPAQAARCITCIKHNHGIAWSLKWYPFRIVAEETELLGIFAASFSDGTLVVQAVPKLDHPPQGKVNCIELSNENIYNHSKSEQMSVVITTLDWSLDGKYLAGGCEDGSIIVWKVDLVTKNSVSLHKIAQTRGHHHLNHSGRVRGIAWSSQDYNLFTSVGDEGFMRFYDVRDVFNSYANIFASRQRATAVIYPPQVSCCLASCGDGFIRQFDTKENNCSNVCQHTQAIWDMSMMSSRAAFSYCCAAGSVTVHSLEEDGFFKKQKKVTEDHIETPVCVTSMVKANSSDTQSQICLSFPYELSISQKKAPKTPKKTPKKATKKSKKEQTEKEELVDEDDKEVENTEEDDFLPFTTAEQADNVKTLINLNAKLESSVPKDAKRKTKTSPVIPDPRQALHSVRFHPSTNKALRNWLVSGGRSGHAVILKVPNFF